MNPFDQLLKLSSAMPCARQRTTRAIAPVGATKVGLLLSHLYSAGPSTTLALCHVVDIEPRLVWGLLKEPVKRGQVERSDGRWRIVDSFDDELRGDLLAAARLLRRHGWSVRGPSGDR